MFVIDTVDKLNDLPTNQQIDTATIIDIDVRYMNLAYCKFQQITITKCKIHTLVLDRCTGWDLTLYNCTIGRIEISDTVLNKFSLPNCTITVCTIVYSNIQFHLDALRDSSIVRSSVRYSWCKLTRLVDTSSAAIFLKSIVTWVDSYDESGLVRSLTGLSNALRVDKYAINYTHYKLYIGCQGHTFDQWNTPTYLMKYLSNYEYRQWLTHKDAVMEFIAKYPAQIV